MNRDSLLYGSVANGVLHRLHFGPFRNLAGKKKENNQKSLLIEFADDTKIGGLRNNEEERSETQSNLNLLVK